jgi:hypothetical protein
MNFQNRFRKPFSREKRDPESRKNHQGNDERLLEWEKKKTGTQYSSFQSGS